MLIDTPSFIVTFLNCHIFVVLVIWHRKAIQWNANKSLFIIIIIIIIITCIIIIITCILLLLHASLLLLLLLLYMFIIIQLSIGILALTSYLSYNELKRTIERQSIQRKLYLNVTVQSGLKYKPSLDY